MSFDYEAYSERLNTAVARGRRWGGLPRLQVARRRRPVAYTPTAELPFMTRARHAAACETARARHARELAARNRLIRASARSLGLID